MSHIPDMEIVHPAHVAVGWLHPDHEFPRGTVPAEFVSKLKHFARRWGNSIDALNWGAAGGYHTCGFCDKFHASGTFGVPAGERVFFVPEMIAHYVEQHRHAPPAEFIAAVMSAPLPGTPEYVRAVASFVMQTE